MESRAGTDDESRVMIIRRLRTWAELRAAHTLEVTAFPADEAESFDVFEERFKRAKSLFFGLFHDRRLIAFIMATRSSQNRVSRRVMLCHEEHGESVCIHSLVVDQHHRGQGYAQALLNAFVRRCPWLMPPVQRIMLAAHENLREFYLNYGFTCIGASDLVYGTQPWLEFHHIITTPNFSIHMVSEHQVYKAAELEQAEYPADEAASLDQLVYRQKHAQDLFWGAFVEEELIGFIVATRAHHCCYKYQEVDKQRGIPASTVAKIKINSHALFFTACLT